MLFIWKFDAHPPPRNANNVEPYTFVTLFSRKFDTPSPSALRNTWMAPYTRRQLETINMAVVTVHAAFGCTGYIFPHLDIVATWLCSQMFVDEEEKSGNIDY